jgi:hypothetical protein
MKNRLTETKLKSALSVTSRLFSRVIALGAVILIYSSASAQDCSIRGFVKDIDGKGAVLA